MRLCVFVATCPGMIRCLNCGTERQTPELPTRYRRVCQAGDEKPYVGPLVGCQHRGPLIEVGSCNVCGMHGQPFQIYRCEVHAKCMVNRYRNDRPDLKVCVNCDDFVATKTVPGLEHGLVS
jgi:hypothetical protein